MSNLPKNVTTDSAEETRQFFDQYFTKSISFPSNEVDAVIAFFEKRSFDKQAAQSVASVLLTQAKIDEVNVFELIDTLQGLTKLQLSKIVATILNYDREKISTIGFKTTSESEKLEKRNIVV
jgi:hypothetical protein